MLKRVLSFLCALLLAVPVNVYASDIWVSAYSAIAIDSGSGTVFYEKNAYEERPMASTTKIMTCLIACESDNLDKTVTISREMLAGIEGSMLYLNEGDKITLLDLIKGAMLASGNDAANAIAFTIGGSVEGFVELMNSRARQIGMKNTVFVTPSGLDEGNHHSTAYDMALLSSVAVENKVFLSICSKSAEEITVSGVKQKIYNHNRLLSSDKGFVGVKTGFTEKAGRCLISAYRYKGNTVIAVTLNAPDDWQDHARLVEYSKKKYKTHASTADYEIPLVGSGENKKVLCCAKYSVTCLGDIEARAYYYPFIYSPVSSGDRVGSLRLYSNGKLIKTVDITVKE